MSLLYPSPGGHGVDRYFEARMPMKVLFQSFMVPPNPATI